MDTKNEPEFYEMTALSCASCSLNSCPDSMSLSEPPSLLVFESRPGAWLLNTMPAFEEPVSLPPLTLAFDLCLMDMPAKCICYIYRDLNNAAKMMNGTCLTKVTFFVAG